MILIYKLIYFRFDTVLDPLVVVKHMTNSYEHEVESGINT